MARRRVEADQLAFYLAGLQAGYAARCAEEATDWREESAQRVYVAGEFYRRPTSAERLADRKQILREGHEAGLHDQPRGACPLCQGDS